MSMTLVSLVSVTPDAEKLIAYCARVSSSNQENPDYAQLLRYCILHGHWSIFEMAHMVVEIGTSRAIAPQILRHRSFSFQEFSQRYAQVQEMPEIVLGRHQDARSRQSSSDTLPKHSQDHWLILQETAYRAAYKDYEYAVKDLGVAREQARLLLPLATPTRLYMAGSVRSWIHYLQLRTQKDTQQEHRDIALAIQAIFVTHFPETSTALGWSPLQEKE